MTQPQAEITHLLSAAQTGDAQAAEQLWQIVYDELHCVAHARLAREAHRDQLQTTVLVQEAYVKLLGADGRLNLRSRQHFFSAAANAMRQFLVDHARKNNARKRGGGSYREPLRDSAAFVCQDPAEVLALDEALNRLAEQDPEMAQIVQLRYFGGLTIEETAGTLDVSSRQVDKKWQFAKAWLHRELS